MRERIERSLPFILVVVVLRISNALLSDTKKKEEPILHECGDYRYRLKEDGTAMITAYLNDEKWPFIPAELDGHAVTGIGDRAFSGNFITDVKIPNSITYTEGNPFAGGENSPRVIIAPDHPTLEIVDDVLFNKVEKTLVAYMRRGESGYQIPKGIKSIGNSAFIENAALTSVRIPDGVTSIGSYAFADCPSLSEINSPDSVASIGRGAFVSCESLTGLIIPESVTSIDSRAFFNCTSLTSMTIPDRVVEIKYETFALCGSLAEVVLPDSLTAIGEMAFSGCDSLTDIVIPDSVTSIGKNTFSHCTGFTSVVIPEGVTAIGDEAFSNCSNLTSVTLPKTLTSIGSDAFKGCPEMLAFTVPRDSWAETWCAENGGSYTYSKE